MGLLPAAFGPLTTGAANITVTNSQSRPSTLDALRRKGSRNESLIE
jgi:hypothetical protein